MIFHLLKMFLLTYFFVFPISKFSDSEFSSVTSETHAHCFLLKDDKQPKQNSTCTLSLCKISVCVSKRLFLLATIKSFSVPPNLSRKSSVESNGMAQIHPGRRYTSWVVRVVSISTFFYSSRMKKACACNGCACS